MAPPKKQATKGQKQIDQGNHETIKFYCGMAASTILINLLFSSSRTSTIFAIFVQVIAIGSLHQWAKGGGIDLTSKDGDSLKDLIITTAICTILSIYSNYLWAIWLWLPVFFVYKIWMSVVVPWVFQPAPEEPEVTEKKRKKLERKAVRAGYR